MEVNNATWTIYWFLFPQHRKEIITHANKWNMSFRSLSYKAENPREYIVHITNGEIG